VTSLVLPGVFFFVRHHRGRSETGLVIDLPESSHSVRLPVAPLNSGFFYTRAPG